MRLIIATAAILMAGSSANIANADPYRWCALDIGQSGSSNCYFLTLEQCRAAVSGAGNFCTPNNFYTGAEDTRERAARRKHG